MKTLAEERDILTYDPGEFGPSFNISGWDCATMKLHLPVFRAMLVTRQSPWLCEQQSDIQGLQAWRPEMCEDLHVQTGLSLKVMADTRSYLQLHDYEKVT